MCKKFRRKEVDAMAGLVAQNGLNFSVDLIYTIAFSHEDYELFDRLFGNLVTFSRKYDEDIVVVWFILNIDEELSKYGGFKDIPTRSIVRKYLPLVVESETFIKSDIGFLRRTLENYIEKETVNERKPSLGIISLARDVEEAVNNPKIHVRNLVLGDMKKKRR